MRYLIICIILSTSLLGSMLQAQPDVSNSLADPVTLKFDNQDLNVKDYLAAQLKNDTTCCQSASYFFSIQYDATGTVTMAKAMTSSPDCTTKILTEAAYQIRWDAKRSIDTKTLYLELDIPTTCKP